MGLLGGYQRDKKDIDMCENKLEKNILMTYVHIQEMQSELKNYCLTFTPKILNRFNSWPALLFSSVLGGSITSF